MNADADARPIRLVQLTDLHLGPDPDFTLAGIPTLRGFIDTLSHTARDWQPDHLILSGDLAADCDAAAYAELARVLATQGVPASCLPGNHDDPALLGRWFPCHHREIEVGGWRLLLLDTGVRGEVAGYLDESGVALLADALAGDDPRPMAVFMHHPPVSVGCAWLDRHRVRNGDQVMAMLTASPVVKAVFAGHVHQDFETVVDGLRVYASPATCFQFLPRSDTFAIDTRPPGFRVIDLDADGRLQTRVAWLEGFPFRPEVGSRGY